MQGERWNKMKKLRDRFFSNSSFPDEMFWPLGMILKSGNTIIVDIIIFIFTERIQWQSPQETEKKRKPSPRGLLLFSQRQKRFLPYQNPLNSVILTALVFLERCKKSQWHGCQGASQKHAEVCFGKADTGRENEINWQNTRCWVVGRLWWHFKKIKWNENILVKYELVE